MDADHALGKGEAQSRGDKRAPVATLSAEAPVSEHVRHQRHEHLGDFLDAEALLSGFERERIPRQRRRDDRERISRVPAEARRVGEHRQ